MTWAKYFSRWFREAGRSHLAAVLSWGFLSLYMLMMLMEVSADGEYVFFGIGSMELCILCAGLGLAFSMIEFFYLFQGRQQDFYYSLPVKKSTVFFSRYVHGVCQFFAPLLLTQMILGVYGAMNSQKFAPYAGGYLGRSIGASMLVFLVFYHTGMLAVAIAGKIAAAVAAAAVFLFYFQAAVQNLFYGYVEEFYQYFYRIPLLEEVKEILAPLGIAKGLMGTEVYDWQEVWEYVPEGKVIAAAVLWAGIFFGLAVLAHRSRKTEMTGRVFVNILAERVLEAAVSLFAGMGLGLLIMDGAQVKGHGAAAVLAMGAGGIAGVCGIHLLTECLVRMPGASLGRRKGQMCAVSICAFAVGCAFLGNQGRFDGYVPERGQVLEVAVSVGGIDMGQKQFIRGENGDDSIAEERLLRYSLAEDESIDEGMAWIQGVVSGLEHGRDADAVHGEVREAKEDRLTSATVCYHFKDGSRCYRRYPLNGEALESFSRVYETEEYKKRAYPLVEVADITKGQVTWSDGVAKKMLAMSESDKAAMLAAYKKDIARLRMEMLGTAFPIGFMEIISEVDGIYLEAMIYPFFERTCKILEEAGADVGKSLVDYGITSVKVKASSPAGQGYSGGVHMQFYDKENDIAKWSEKLIPDSFAVQPVLRPVDSSVQAEVQVEDEAANGAVVVDCYGVEERGGK